MSTYKKYLNPDILFYLLIALSILTFALLQPFGDPPDEVNRYKVAQFICNYGKLPTGEEFEVAIGGYGGSYAFQPILPYMIQGFFMRFVSLFTRHNLVLLLCARMINVLFGIIMAVYVRKLAVILFKDSLTGWLFSCLVMLLPQNLFLHSYVNTDSMASMAGAMILYACATGIHSGWQKKSCLTLSIGIIFCALSYYNAYGLILTAILLFFLSFWKREKNGALVFQWHAFLKTGSAVALIVLAGISWWFIRNYKIHNGDILGLRARMEHAARTALPEYNPKTRMTVAASGASLWDMLFHMDFFYFLWNSFVARFGPMTIPTLPFLYIWYYRIFGFGWLFCLIPRKWSITASPAQKRSGSSHSDTHFLCIFYQLSLLLTVLITFGLCIYYSYTSDYQPQGRYIMPMLLPFMYFITLGFHKLTALLEAYFPYDALKRLFRPVIFGGLLLFLIGSLILTLTCVIVPHYLSGIHFWNAEWIPL